MKNTKITWRLVVINTLFVSSLLGCANNNKVMVDPGPGGQSTAGDAGSVIVRDHRAASQDVVGASRVPVVRDQRTDNQMAADWSCKGGAVKMIRDNRDVAERSVLQCRGGSFIREDRNAPQRVENWECSAGGAVAVVRGVQDSRLECIRGTFVLK